MWDDDATWTGSVLRHDGRWNMLYTGTCGEEQGLIQRIGLATSDDLVHWRKHEANPVIEADPRWYELLDLDAWFNQAWRDPWLFHHPRAGDVHALITARSAGPGRARGDPRPPAPIDKQTAGLERGRRPRHPYIHPYNGIDRGSDRSTARSGPVGGAQITALPAASPAPEGAGHRRICAPGRCQEAW